MVSLRSRRVWTVVIAVLMAVPFTGLEVSLTARAAGAAPTIGNYRGIYVADPAEIAVGSDGALWFTNNASDSIGRIITVGTTTNYAETNYTGIGISHPYGI